MINTILWHVGLKNDCPLCGSSMIVHGFEGYNRTYTCTNDECEWK